MSYTLIKNVPLNIHALHVSHTENIISDPNSAKHFRLIESQVMPSAVRSTFLIKSRHSCAESAVPIDRSSSPSTYPVTKKHCLSSIKNNKCSINSIKMVR